MVQGSRHTCPSRVLTEAARLLNVGRTTLVEKIRKYDLNVDPDRVA